MDIKFTVPGQPVPKQRPRVLKSGITYTPQRTADYEECVRLCYGNKGYFEKGIPLEIEIWCYFKIPDSWSKAKKEDAENGKIFVTKRPDNDNLEKIIGDALSGVAFYDDSQIVDSHVYKRYSKEPRAEIIIRKKEV